MIGQLENECISLSVLSSMAQLRYPSVAEYFKGLSLVDHTSAASYTGLEGSKVRTIAETVVRSTVASV